jgi:hypothetical protein
MKKVLLAIAMASALLAGCGDQPIEGTITQVEREAGEWECKKRDRKGNCTKTEWDDPDCVLHIKPPKEANETDQAYANVKPVEVDVPCDKKFDTYRVGDYWNQ